MCSYRSALACVLFTLITACQSEPPLVSLEKQAPAATPVSPAKNADPNLQALALPKGAPGDYFLLKSDGTPYYTSGGQKVEEIKLREESKDYTTKLQINARRSFNPANKISAYYVKVGLEGTADGSHTFSQNLPTVFLEVDGETLPPELVKVEVSRSPMGDTAQLTLTPKGADLVHRATKKVAVKAQLRTDRIANSNYCKDDTQGVLDVKDCAFPFVGYNVQGKNLAALKKLFAPKT
jgi:hypothetical protein